MGIFCPGKKLRGLLAEERGWELLLRQSSTEWSESRGGVQASGKITNERNHCGVPEAVEAEEIHLMHSLFHGPLFKGHAVGGHEDAGAILAETAVDENFLRGVLMEEREELKNLLVGGSGPLADGDADETHAHGLDLLAFPLDFGGILEAQIDDGVDAEFLEFDEALGFRLRAAVKMFVDLAAIGDIGDAKFFSVGGMHFGRSRSTLRGKRAREENERKEREGKHKAFHSGLDAWSVARVGQRVKGVASRTVMKKGYHYK